MKFHPKDVKAGAGGMAQVPERLPRGLSQTPEPPIIIIVIRILDRRTEAAQGKS
jgi:hypothetical protein